MPYTLRFEMTGLAVLVQHTDDGKAAQVLWLRGEWDKVPRHKAILAVDLAQTTNPDVNGLPNDVVRLADGRTIMLIDLRGTDLSIDDDVPGSGVRLKVRNDDLPNPGNKSSVWTDLRYIAGMDLVTTGGVPPSFVVPNTYEGQVQGRMIFNKGIFSAAMPHDPQYRRLWLFRGGRKQYLSDRLIWTYTRADGKPIDVSIRRGGDEAVFSLHPKGGKGTNVKLSASCYPAVSGGRSRLPLATRLGRKKDLRWDDFPVFYEVIDPDVPGPDRDRPSTNGPMTSINDVWCPSARAEMKQAEPAKSRKDLVVRASPQRG